MRSRFFLSSFLFSVLFILIDCSKGSDPKPTTNTLTSCFTPSATSAAANATLTFTSCSQNATTYSWDFGDGSTSTLQNPTHSYSSAGSYAVKLTTGDGKTSKSTSQTITITAASSSNCTTHTGFISANETWAKGCHIINNFLVIESGAVVTIAPGAVVKFNKGANVSIAYSQNSALIAEGTTTDPILFTSNATTPAPGDWDEIAIGSFTATPSSFKYCVFEYGGLSTSSEHRGMISITDGGKVNIDHCEFRKSISYAAQLDNKSGFNIFTNNYIHDINDFALLITGNNAGSIGLGNNIVSKGVLIDSWQVTQDAQWKALTCPYVPASNLWIGSDAGNTLILDAGVKIAFQADESILPNYSTSIATLITNGTAQNPVIFTALDSAATSRWGGVSLGDRFTNNTYFRYTIFAKAKSTVQSNGVITITGNKLNMENCKISGDKQFGIIMGLNAQLGTFANNDFGAVNSYSINLHTPDLAQIGNGNTFSGGKDVRLDFVEIKDNVTFYPLSVNYYRYGDIYIGSTTGNTVVIKPGVKFLLDISTIYVGQGYATGDVMPATLTAVGTSAQPIIFQRVLPTNNNGDMISFEPNSNPSSILSYCNILGPSIGVRVDNLNNTSANPYPTISNCSISNCVAYPIYVAHSTPIITGNTYLNNGTNSVYTLP